MTDIEVSFVDTPFGRLAYTIDGEGEGTPLLLASRYRATIEDWDPRFIKVVSANRRACL